MIANNESLKDSIFQQSQGKKGDRRRDLEKIEEHADSKYYDDDFDQIKDDVQMSLSISQTAPYQQGAKPGANPGQQKNNGSLKKKGTFEDGRTFMMKNLGQVISTRRV